MSSDLNDEKQAAIQVLGGKWLKKVDSRKEKEKERKEKKRKKKKKKGDSKCKGLEVESKVQEGQFLWNEVHQEESGKKCKWRDKQVLDHVGPFTL